jgi:hypothetical protein
VFLPDFTNWFFLTLCDGNGDACSGLTNQKLEHNVLI